MNDIKEAKEQRGGCVIPIMVLASVGALVCLPAVSALVIGARNQSKGTAYMEGLSRADIPRIIGESEALLARLATSSTDVITYTRHSDPPVPKNFSAMGLSGINVSKDSVRFVWMGGLDHTYLLVSRDSENNWRVTAHFDDDLPERQLFP